MDQITTGLVRDARHDRLSADELKDLAKKASDMHLEEDVSMTRAVVKVAQDGRHLTVEQAKRLTEFANNATYLALFEKQAGDKIVDFDIADPRDVLRELDIQARPRQVESNQDFFDTDASKLGQDTVAMDRRLAAAFGVVEPAPVKVAAAQPDIPDGIKIAMGMPTGGMPSTMGGQGAAPPGPISTGAISGMATKMSPAAQPSPPTAASGGGPIKTGGYPMAEPHGDLFRLRPQLQKLADDARAAVSTNQMWRDEAFEKLCSETKQWVLNGHNIGEAVDAMAQVAEPKLVKQAFAEVLAHFAETDPYVFPDLTKTQVDLINYEMAKTAGLREVNTEHPLVKAFAAMAGFDDGHKKLAASKARVDEMLKEVNDQIAAVLRS